MSLAKPLFPEPRGICTHLALCFQCGVAAGTGVETFWLQEAWTTAARSGMDRGT